MMRFVRPEEPTGFDAAVRVARERIDLALAEGRPLDEKEDFPDLWSKYKPVLAQAQHGKCGYCERDITTHGGHVEHFRPKGALQDLPDDPRERGREEPYTGRVASPRRLTRLCDHGYPWLAYEWTNYLVACERCNSGWKRCLFPVAETPRSIPPARARNETPLLLDPFGDDDPVDHLEFTLVGGVQSRGGSLKGRATIDTCGLDRSSLVRSRALIARGIEALLFDLHEATTPEAKERVLRRLREMGDPAHPHAGMVRSIVAVFLGLSWSEIEMA
jgi:hypothetical protein